MVTATSKATTSRIGENRIRIPSAAHASNPLFTFQNQRRDRAGRASQPVSMDMETCGGEGGEIPWLPASRSRASVKN